MKTTTSKTKNNNQRSWFHFLLISFATLLIISPFPLGSNRVFASASISIALCALCFIGLIGYVRSPKELMKNLRFCKSALLFFIGYIGWLTIQLIYLNGDQITVDAHHTKQQLLISLGYFSAFVLVNLIIKCEQDIKKLTLYIIFSGLLQATIAIFLYSEKANYSIFNFSMDHSQRTYGTFSYHNSLANYMLICLSLGIGILISDLMKFGNMQISIRNRIKNLMVFILSPSMLIRLMLVVMVIALVLTKSRMGNAAFLLSIMLIAIPLLAVHFRNNFKVLLLLISVIFIDLLIIGNLVGVDRVINRISQTTIENSIQIKEESIENRSAAARLGYEMFKDRSLTGWGAGTFYTVFPAYANNDARQYYDHAHNDYIQFLAETGVIGSFFLAALTIGGIKNLLSITKQQGISTYKGIAIGIFIAVFGCLLQATVDFHFQIPANALLFVVLIAMSWRLTYFALNQKLEMNLHTNINGLKNESIYR